MSRKEKLEEFQSKTNILFVEGEDDRRFFSKLCDKLQIRKVVGIVSLGGTSEWQSELPQYLRVITAQHKSISFIRDADDDYKKAFEEIQTIVEKSKTNVSGLPLNTLIFPKSPEKFSNSLPKLGVFILPKKNIEGSLEDLCLQSFEENKTNLKCANQFRECLNKTITHTTTKHKSKKELQSILLEIQFQSYLASTENNFSFSYTPGTAAREGYLDFSHKAFTQLKNFLQEFAK